MPELPEVETVKEALKCNLLSKRITKVSVYYDKIIQNMSKEEFINNIINESIVDIKRVGKYLVFVLEKHILLSHLRMEGKYNYFPNYENKVNKHDHIVFYFENGEGLVYNDTRKFGTMELFNTNLLEDVMKEKPLNKLGIEPLSSELTFDYLKGKLNKLKKPIKTVLLDQSIISGLGNIYADEVCYMSKINPLMPVNKLTDEDINNIIDSSNKVIAKAIKLGGTTIRSFTSSHMITGRFQNELLVHTKDMCECGNKITKIFVSGRGTYYCDKCQKLGE